MASQEKIQPKVEPIDGQGPDAEEFPDFHPRNLSVVPFDIEKILKEFELN